jgi:hypothetical protein
VGTTIVTLAAHSITEAPSRDRHTPLRTPWVFGVTAGDADDSDTVGAAHSVLDIITKISARLRQLGARNILYIEESCSTSSLQKCGSQRWRWCEDHRYAALLTSSKINTDPKEIYGFSARVAAEVVCTDSNLFTFPSASSQASSSSSSSSLTLSIPNWSSRTKWAVVRALDDTLSCGIIPVDPQWHSYHSSVFLSRHHSAHQCINEGDQLSFGNAIRMPQRIRDNLVQRAAALLTVLPSPFSNATTMGSFGDLLARSTDDAFAITCISHCPTVYQMFLSALKSSPSPLVSDVIFRCYNLERNSSKRKATTVSNSCSFSALSVFVLHIYSLVFGGGARQGG